MIELNVETIEHPGYLEFVCSGDHVPEDWEALIDLVLQASARTGITRVLVNGMQLNFSMQNMTRYRIGLQVAEKFGPAFKIAALTPQEDINLFWETVAHNRGAKVKTASDRATLVAWLGEPD